MTRLDIPSTYDEVFEAILAGHSAFLTMPSLLNLPDHDRQRLLCVLCSIHNEIVGNCQQRGNEVSTLLTSQCPLFIEGEATWSHEDLLFNIAVGRCCTDRAVGRCQTW